jgi:methionine biosynthesis protein MetW
MLRKFLAELKRESEYLNWGREIVVEFVSKYALRGETIRVLDLGPGEGADLMNVKETFVSSNVELFGVECYDEYVSNLQQKGVNVCKLNIERERFPFEDKTFDIIIANQILEHTKEIFWILSEISRVLKPGGIAIIGVPNLASFHNRMMLLFGMQPSSIEILGPHVRGFTKKSFEQFVTTNSFFQVLETKGANFYPFPASLANIISNIFPSMSVGLFFCLRRTEKQGTFIEVLQQNFFQTNYFDGTTL